MPIPQYPSFSEASSVAHGTVTSSGFFKALKRRSNERAEEVIADFSDRMLAILRNRRSLSAGGKYPRWSPTPKEPHSSLGSYAQWKKYFQPGTAFSTHVMLYNPATRPGGFNYPSVLISGEGAPKSWGETADRGVTLKGEPAKVVRNGEGVFSTQMPQGLSPWLLLKRVQLRDELSAMLKTRKRY